MFQPLFFTVYILSLGVLQAEVTEKLSRLSNPLVGDDGRVYTCAEKNFFAFESNGSVAWKIRLGYLCHTDVAPAFDRNGKIYLIAEDRVLTIIPPKDKSSKPLLRIFFGPGMPLGVSGEILGFALGIWTQALFITIANSGIYAFKLDGTSLWSAGSAFYQLIYPQACWSNVTSCSFTSGPVIDECEASIYVVNSEGQVYSISSLKPYVNWVQDLGAIDNLITVTSGNNGFVYLALPRKSMVMALDAADGTVLWQNYVGPLNAYRCSLLVDSSGWASVGSLDGSVYSLSPTGFVQKNLQGTASSAVIQVDPVLDCSDRSVYAAQLKVRSKSNHASGDHSSVSATGPLDLIFTMFSPSTGDVHWVEHYPGQLSSMLSGSYIRHFILDARILLAFITASNMGGCPLCHTARAIIRPNIFPTPAFQMRSSCGNVYMQDPTCPKSCTPVVVLIVLSGVVRFCCIFWGKEKLQDQNLDEFLWNRLSLRTRKKVYDEMIPELEAKASADPTDEQVQEQMQEMMKERREIERKLLTTYSLGRDSPDRQFGTLLPLHQSKLKNTSHSLQRSDKRIVSMFNTLDATSSEEEEEIGGGGGGHRTSYCMDKESATRMKEPREIEPNELRNAVPLRRMATGEGRDSLRRLASGSGFTNPLFDEEPLTDEIMNDSESDRERMTRRALHGNVFIKRRSSLNSAG